MKKSSMRKTVAACMQMFKKRPLKTTVVVLNISFTHHIFFIVRPPTNSMIRMFDH